MLITKSFQHALINWVINSLIRLQAFGITPCYDPTIACPNCEVILNIQAKDTVNK
jgi:hypothetical protein